MLIRILAGFVGMFQRVKCLVLWQILTYTTSADLNTVGGALTLRFVEFADNT